MRPLKIHSLITVLHVSETGLFNMGGDDDVMLGRAGQGVDLVQSHAVTLFKIQILIGLFLHKIVQCSWIR